MSAEMILLNKNLTSDECEKLYKRALEKRLSIYKKIASDLPKLKDSDSISRYMGAASIVMGFI